MSNKGSNKGLTNNGVMVYHYGMKKKNTKNSPVESGLKGFLELCSQIRTPEDLNRVFDLFLTIEEKENIASRYLIIKNLLEGQLTQRDIAETHKVSIAQITRGSNALKIVDTELKKLLKTKLT